jgi:glutaredoxin
MAIAPARNWKWLVINTLAIAAAVAIGLPIGYFLQAKWGGTGQSLQVQSLAGSISSQHFTDSRFDFLLLGDTRCDFCKDGIHFLDEIGVRYRVIYLDKEPQSRILLDQLGAQGVPVFMSKKQYVIGFGKSTWLRLMEGTGVGASN